MNLKPPRELSPEEALSRLQNLCSAQEKCSGDVMKKLRQWKISEANSEKILLSLKKDKFIDDQRFTGFFVRDKQKINKWGKEKIRYALKSKGLSQEIINEGLLTLPLENFENALRELLAKKSRELSEYQPYEKKNRLIRFAVQRGFDYDLVFKVIDDYVNS
jgi:regulatory protein